MQRLGVSMIHQELNLLNELSVAQNIFLCREPRGGAGLINFNRMHEEAAGILSKLGEKIDPRRKVRDLKIAQKQMVEIAKAISFNVELLVMDEPTSALTGRETAILFELISNLSSQGIAVVYISHRLKEIIDSIANMDNAEHGMASLRAGLISIRRIVEEVMDSFQPEAGNKHIALSSETGPDDLLVEGDAAKISIILNNVVRNAIDFNNPGGHVTIATKQVPGYIQISVIDDGIGIPEKDLPHVFERFYQVESHLTRRHNGMGLGLSVPSQRRFINL